MVQRWLGLLARTLPWSEAFAIRLGIGAAVSCGDSAQGILVECNAVLYIGFRTRNNVRAVLH